MYLFWGSKNPPVSSDLKPPLTTLVSRMVLFGQENKNSNFHKFLPDLHKKFKSETPLLIFFYFRRFYEQRHAVENSRGASKNCIERNTFPHKFKHIPREKSENEKDDPKNNDDLQVDKCTICLCGKF